MNDFRKLNVWLKAVDLSVVIYKITETYPVKERFGLVSQINRSCVSIASNIAEGAGRNTKKEFNYFLNIALGSSFECETQLIISNKLGFISDTAFTNLKVEMEKVQKMLVGLRNSNSEVIGN